MKKVTSAEKNEEKRLWCIIDYWKEKMIIKGMSLPFYLKEEQWQRN